MLFVIILQRNLLHNFSRKITFKFVNYQLACILLFTIMAVSFWAVEALLILGLG